jgi:lactoylglutathione lyase
MSNGGIGKPWSELSRNENPSGGTEMIKGITHVALLVTDIDKSLDFYCNKLGIKEKFRINKDDGTPHLIYLEVTPNQFIELFPGAQGAFQRPSTSATVHFCLQVDDIQKAYEEFKSRGGVPHSEPMFAMDNAWQFWTNDPDGNPIEFHQFTAESMQIVGNAG